MRILVIGGTGPTGPHIVNGLVDRGHDVTILHTGRHEVDTLPPPSMVPHIHADPFDHDSFTEALAGQTYDVVFAMYGRLRMVVDALIEVTPRLFTVGGVPVYPGYSNDTDRFPTGMRLPSAEEDAFAPLGTYDETTLAEVAARGDRSAKVVKIIESEALVFERHPDATHFRYPYIYGPNQVLPKEWPVMKRALDGRRPLILADGGRTVESAAFVENVAHAVLLAVDHIDQSAGRVYNVADDELLTRGQIAEVVADELGHEFEMINLPFELARSAYPTLSHHSSEHRVVDTSRIRTELGYRDLVAPVEALRRTARWQAEHLPAQHDRIKKMLQDPFDYAAEDRLVELYHHFVADARAVEWDREPGYTVAYYGPLENPGGKRPNLRA
ncbi:MAG: NAD(P)H-binding protein [Actinomycetia bacterium]|nr:NAD(P)H-binding protein [Actinomycetes bacterium]